MADAMELLGYTHCAHGFDLMDSPAYAARWERAIDAKWHNKGVPFERPEWDELLGHCAAVTDFPCTAFWRELVAAYPDAKVILVQRDEDKWYDSFCEGIIAPMFTPTGKFTLNYIEPLMGSRVGAGALKVAQGWCGAETEEGMKANAWAAYRRHYKEVKAVVSKDKLLEFQLGSGWEPLCRFLGREKPDAAFPWVNEKDALQEKIEGFKALKQAELKQAVTRKVLPVVAAIAIAVTAWRWS